MSAWFKSLDRQFFRGRSSEWVSGLLLGVCTLCGTTVALAALRDAAAVVFRLVIGVLVVGLLTCGLAVVSKRFGRSCSGGRTRPLVWIPGVMFAGLNLAIAVGLLVVAAATLAVFGSAWWVLLTTSAILASVTVLLLGVVPRLPIRSLVLCYQPVPEHGNSLVDWPVRLVLSERQRRARQADAASVRPLLEELRDALDADAHGVHSRGIWIPVRAHWLRELGDRLAALCIPAGLAVGVTALVLLRTGPMLHARSNAPWANDTFSEKSKAASELRNVQRQSVGLNNLPASQAAGGQATAGQAAGGQAAGGQAAGGQAAGGQAAGGQATGGQATGGKAAGEKGAGGQATGGQAAGKQATGKQATGGQATGGQAAGLQSTDGDPSDSRADSTDRDWPEPADLKANVVIPSPEIPRPVTSRPKDSGDSSQRQHDARLPAKLNSQLAAPIPPGTGVATVLKFGGGTQVGGKSSSSTGPFKRNEDRDSFEVRTHTSEAVRSQAMKPIQPPLLQLRLNRAMLAPK